MLCAAFSHSSSLWLTPQMEPKAGRTPCSVRCTTSSSSTILHSIWFLTRPVCPKRLLFKSSLPSSPHSPHFRQLQTLTCTHKYCTDAGLFQSVLCTSSLTQRCQYPALMRHRPPYKGHAATLCVLKVCFKSVALLPEPLPGNWAVSALRDCKRKDEVKELHRWTTRWNQCDA